MRIMSESSREFSYGSPGSSRAHCHSYAPLAREPERSISDTGACIVPSRDGEFTQGIKRNLLTALCQLKSAKVIPHRGAALSTSRFHLRLIPFVLEKISTKRIQGNALIDPVGLVLRNVLAFTNPRNARGRVPI